MNKTAIKNFAVWARVQLMEAAKQNAYEYDVTEEGENKPGQTAAGRPLSPEEVQQRNQLLAQIRRKGFRQVMEEAAYTWFNRLIALRFMEVNGYLSVRAFTDGSGAFRPELLQEAMRVELEGLDREKVLELLDKRDDEALYKYLFITQCNALNRPLPRMFERISDWTELLFPANLLRADSVVGRMVSEIPEEDWKDQVQIIGWLYQYYNAELKDETFALLKKNVKITKERVPAATQLFTPDWIVRYMVENSLGRLWLEGHPDGALKANWNYYLDEAEQEPETAARLAELRKAREALQPEEIKLIDPCMGSGHILVYAFDVLMQIYLAQGWPERDAARSIVENNLYGLDIDERAAQLAYFAVMMKARQYDRRFLTRGVQPKTFCTAADPEGSEFGSLLAVRELDPLPVAEDLFGGSEEGWNYRNLLAQKYDVVVTNPPYMAVSNADKKLQDYIKKNFPDSKSDLFACFIERCGQLTKKDGCQAMITQHSWMFLSSFEKLREKLQAFDTVNMAHLGARAFDAIGGEVVQTVSFIMRKSHIKGYKGTYCRLIEPTTQQGKEEMFLAGENRYIAQQDNFSKIPGLRIGYWLSDTLRNQFEKLPVSAYADTRRGLQTGNAGRFIRKWFEVSSKNENLCPNRNSRELPLKWFLFNSGGAFRRWYGNIVDVVNWADGGKEIKETGKAIIPSEERYFDELISWNKISSGQMSVRYQPAGIIPGDASPFLHTVNQDQDIILYAMAIFNSKVTAEIVKVLSPTLNFEVGNIAEIPLAIDEQIQGKVLLLVHRCITISKTDWDSFETSWDFKKHPMV